MDRKFFYFFTFLLFYLCLPSAVMAQGMVTEIKIVAVQEEDSLKEQAKGYKGGDNIDLDFRKGRGGGYVFALSKNSTDTAKYITSVFIGKRTAFGVEFDENGKKYKPAQYFQAEKHFDKKYRGGLNGRDYSIYGGSYIEQPHVYVSRTGNTDFNNQVLKEVYVTTTRPTGLPADATYIGGLAGGGRYFVFRWHTHEPKFKKKVSNSAPSGDINWHIRYCERDQCGIAHDEPHNFLKIYNQDKWMQLTKSDSLKSPKSHYKKCLDCGQIVYDNHKWATFVSNWKDHTKRCLVCDYVEQADHKNFGQQKIPVDEYYHMIYCDDCGFLQKCPHDYDDNRFVVRADCEGTVVKYTCKQCYHQAHFEEAGIGHDYDAYGICRRKNCQHPYQQPATEPAANGDSVFVIKTFGHLYWVADYVNNRRSNANIRLDNDLEAEDFMRLPWKPIGATDSTAFKGTFDGGGHIISMLRTEKPVAGTDYRGLFGAIGKGATVKNVILASCHFRGWNNVGAVAGINNGTIESCHVAFTIVNSIGTGMNLGGICGTNKGTITGCSTDNSVWIGGVRDYAGGICGSNSGGTILGNFSMAICGSGSDAMLPEAASEE